MEYKFFTQTRHGKVALLEMNRPEAANALDRAAWDELKFAFEALDEDREVRAIVLAGKGKHFCAGIDLSLLASIDLMIEDTCTGRKGEKLRRLILELQDTINAIEKCRKPVLAAVQGGCLGGGLDIICACDMRFATQDAFFSVKEIAVGMVADLGSLQRLPKLIPDGHAREMAFTGRHVPAGEAREMGLVNRVFDTREEMLEQVLGVAAQIAANSPLSVRGSKEVLNYSRDHTVVDGLNYVATWNAGMLLSADLDEALKAQKERRKPAFE
ncbi:MAG: crotonase/enoyl-CoA hydratase family protein [Bacteroidia bacterium]|nr:crotonase/enoyl-CoA hydratase family protein [Bacteroidia bacterium]